jgi:hypothetical protein
VIRIPVLQDMTRHRLISAAWHYEGWYWLHRQGRAVHEE